MEQGIGGFNNSDIVEIAKEYYIRDKNQREIAEKFGVSHSTVSRALKHAREFGIVRFQIVDHDLVCSNLGTQLAEKFGLTKVIVVEGNPESAGLNTRDIGAAAARLTHRMIKDDMIISFSWGSTIYELVQNIVPKKVSGLKVVQLMGSMLMGNIRTRHFATQIPRRMITAYGCAYHVLPAPAVAQSEESLQVFLEEPVIHEVMELGRKSDIVLLGIGLCDETSNMVTAGYANLKELKELERLGAAGEIASRFYDKEGRPIYSELDSRTLSISLEQLKEIPTKIVAAGGTRKVDAIHKAIIGGYVDYLITDMYVAKKLLKLED